MMKSSSAVAENVYLIMKLIIICQNISDKKGNMFKNVLSKSNLKNLTNLADIGVIK